MPNGAAVNRAYVIRSVQVVLALIASACSPPPAATTRFPLDLHAASANGNAVAGVRAWADGDDLGTTAADGSLRAELRGHEGQAVALSIACPPGFRAPDSRRRVVLQRLAGRTNTPANTLTNTPVTNPALALRVACEPTERSAILIVRARAQGPLAGVPIRRDDVVVAQTDLDGTAHVLLKVRPATSLRIALDTSAWPALVPRDPVQSYELADEDSILLVDPSFTTRPVAPVRAPRKTHKPSSTSTSRAPYRIR